MTRSLGLRERCRPLAEGIGALREHRLRALAGIWLCRHWEILEICFHTVIAERMRSRDLRRPHQRLFGPEHA